MIKKSFCIAAALACAWAMQAEAYTTALTVDAQWHEFDVDDLAASSGGLEWINLNGDTLDFSFTLTGPAILKVVDGGYAGDRFEVFDNGVSLGPTSAVAVSSYDPQVNPVTNFDAAYADARFSRGEYWLNAGVHSISGLLTTSVLDAQGLLPLNATIGAVSLTAVPIPAAGGLFLAGCSVIGAFARRRSN